MNYNTGVAEYRDIRCYCWFSGYGEDQLIKPGGEV